MTDEETRVSCFQLAQLNIAVLKAPLESPVMADFVEALERLEHLRAKGPSPRAFTFRNAYPAPDASEPGVPFAFGADCPAT